MAVNKAEGAWARVGAGGAWTALPIRPQSQHRNPWGACSPGVRAPEAGATAP